jgi:heme-degrading monooxygenase HmoA
MTFARVVDVKFKPGMREEALNVIADISKDVRSGFEGMLVLIPTNDPDSATYVTLWDSEDAMNDSWKEINPRATEALKNMLVGETVMRTNEVRLVQRLTIPA